MNKLDKKIYDKKYYANHREQKKKYVKQYRMEYPEETREQKKKCYIKHKEQRLQHNEQYWETHHQQILEQQKKFRKAHSEELKESRRERRINHPEKVRKWDASHQNKRRDLGSNFLNESFKNSEAHHINENDVIFISKEIHRSVFHCLKTGRNMEKINKLAMGFI